MSDLPLWMSRRRPTATGIGKVECRHRKALVRKLRFQNIADTEIDAATSAKFINSQLKAFGDTKSLQKFIKFTRVHKSSQKFTKFTKLSKVHFLFVKTDLK